MKTIGLIGAGHIASQLARLAVKNGYDVVISIDVGPLSERWRIQRDTPGYGPRRTAEALRKDLTAAKRPPK